MATIKWRGVEEIQNNMTLYEQKVMYAVSQVMQFVGAKMETYAKENAPWTDRTGAARSGLFHLVRPLSENMVGLYLSHSPAVDYGIWLEVKNNSRYEIVWPAIEQHLDELKKMLQEIFK